MLISALTGAGIDGLTLRMAEILGGVRHHYTAILSPSDGAALAWLHDHAEVISRKLLGQDTHIQVKMNSADHNRFTQKFHITPIKSS